MIIHFTLPPFSPTLYSVLRNNLPDESGLVFLDSSDNELLWPTHISKKKGSGARTVYYKTVVIN